LRSSQTLLQRCREETSRDTGQRRNIRGALKRSRPRSGNHAPDLGLRARASDGNRTRVTSLGSWSSTIELHSPAATGESGCDDMLPKTAALASQVVGVSGSGAVGRAGRFAGSFAGVLLSDRDIRAEI